MIFPLATSIASLAVMFGVDRSAVTRAVHEIRPLLRHRVQPHGCVIHGGHGITGALERTADRRTHLDLIVDYENIGHR